MDQAAMRSLLFVVLSLAFVSAHAAEQLAPQSTISWTLSLDADGRIVKLKPTDPDDLPDVRKQLEPIVRAWHFTPGKVDGRPAPTETTLGVRVAFEPESTNAIRYHVRIDSADTGATYRHMVAPRYPQSSQKAKEEGEVVLWINYDATGAVTSVRNVPAMSADNVSQALIDAATDAAKHWTFRTEMVDGRGVAGEALAPFCFKLRDEPCHWKPWRDKTRPIQSGGAVALSSVVGLDTGEARQLP
jgi:TonB family protein